ncbi:MAG: hydratase [Firmicutes bacterium]|nr:hydratase [Bacillota bacterium]
MITLSARPFYWIEGRPVEAEEAEARFAERLGSRADTMAYQILQRHNRSKDPALMQITFDALASHDITYVGIIQTARASGLKEFPMPYALTNCHNSLCAVGGTINEDDHVFGLSAARKYGGLYVPANVAVIHQYAREVLAKAGNMVLGSDSHTRYGALGTMGVGEGGPELVKQLLKNTYDVPAPEVVMVYLEGAPRPGVGPHDVAIALCGAVFKNGFVKNKILEFVGPGIAALPMDFRIGIDVMTTETTCLSSIWETDERVQDFYTIHGRPGDYAKLSPCEGARYDSLIRIDLSKVESMIALPFHPSNAFTVHELQANAADILREVEKEAAKTFGGKVQLHLTDKVTAKGLQVDQGVIAGCAGGMYDNICEAASILRGASTGSGYFSLSVYPSSLPVQLALFRNGAASALTEAGAIFKPCFCGPCFGAGDVPSNNGLSIRHSTRNFPNREGSKPGEGQISSVALMDARSIAATAARGGILTAATDITYDASHEPYRFDSSVYANRVYNGWGSPHPEEELRFGPNITDWPRMYPLEQNILLKFCAVIHDPVTTTDELIPSGETSSYRSNPERLSQFALSRRVPDYVKRSLKVRNAEGHRRNQQLVEELESLLRCVNVNLPDLDVTAANTAYGSAIFARKPGDGSAREQAASCQKVLGGLANICYEYATKRYRSNCINWGILPFTMPTGTEFDLPEESYLLVPDIRQAVIDHREQIQAYSITDYGVSPMILELKGLTDDERTILLEGSLINYYGTKARQA